MLAEPEGAHAAEGAKGRTRGPLVDPADLQKLKEENDQLERAIMEQTRKLTWTEDAAATQEFAAPRKVGGIQVIQFSLLPQFMSEAISDDTTPFMPSQCKQRKHNGGMFTS